MGGDEVRTSKVDELRVVNRSVVRHDAVEKVRGATRYSADFDLGGMLYARLVRSQVPSARLVSRDVSEARKVPGVVAVLLGEDVPNNEVWMDVPGPPGTEVQALRSVIQILATERIRYHGEPIALIVAESEDVFAEAEEGVHIEYEELPVVATPLEALAEGAPLVHETGNLLVEWNIDRGDVDAAFARAATLVESEYCTQFVDPGYLEPEAGVAWLDENGVIVIRAGTQAVEHFRDVARILGLPNSKVRVVTPYVGGGFGGKEGMTVEPYLGLAVYRLRRPVKMVWTRQESLLARPKRHPMTMRYRSAALADGTLLGHEIDITADAGAYALLSALVLLTSAVLAGGPYEVANLRLRSRAVYTNNPPASAMRGFGGMQVVFGYESQMDRLARTLGIDRVEIRKKNAIAEGDELPVGQRIETEVHLAETTDAVLEVAGSKPQASGPRSRVGRGIASNLQPYGRLVWLKDTSSAWIGLDLDGSVVMRIGIPDIGGGQTSSLIQIASEVLGVPMENIALHFGDSALTPLAGTTTATRQLYMSGNAVYKTAVELRDMVANAVADETGQPVESLTFVDAEVRGSDRSVSITDAVAICLKRGVPITHFATFHGPRGVEVGRELHGDRIFPDFTFGTHLVDVEIDMETGALSILQYVASHDVGRAINPQSVEGQIRGAVAMGVGQALMEEVTVENGVNLIGGFFQYLIPTAADLPEINVVVVESGEGMGPLGARGIGEPPIGPCAAALASAIEDAVGVRPTVLPMSPERIMDCIKGA